MTIIYLALGSNMGERRKNIAAALSALKKSGITINRVSSLIETAPAGGPAQAKYLNGVLQASTKLSPQQLLKKLKGIEIKMGRAPVLRNGPRPIDIDILLYNTISLKTPELVIPHPAMFKRPFVMAPLKEIFPGTSAKTI